TLLSWRIDRRRLAGSALVGLAQQIGRRETAAFRSVFQKLFHQLNHALVSCAARLSIAARWVVAFLKLLHLHPALEQLAKSRIVELRRSAGLVHHTVLHERLEIIGEPLFEVFHEVAERL